jgi:hypothetical protein
MPEHLAGIAGQLHGLGHTRDVASGPGVLLALGLREGDLAGVVVPQLDPGLQDLPGSGGGLVDHPEEELLQQGDLGGGANVRGRYISVDELSVKRSLIYHLIL